MNVLKKYVFHITAGISLLAFLALNVASARMAQREESQLMARRWDKDGGVSQISCFFSINGAMNEDRIEEFEHELDTKLVEASISVDTYGLKSGERRNENARLWADAYSADGKVSITGKKNTISVKALGVGGDFFLFHPLELINGAYFSGNDLNSDYIILDEDAAWQLFGSNNVVGQIVDISGMPHIVTGVIRRQQGKIYEKAGLNESLCYVSYETLTRYGTINYGSMENAINHYEIVMPNPVKGFAYNLVKESFGADEKNVEIVENTDRYSLLSVLNVLLAFGTRSMNGKAIIYPYWENAARGYEDKLAFLLVFRLLFLLYPAVVLIVLLIRYWKRKGWTLKEKVLWLFGLIEERRQKKLKEEYFEEEEKNEKVKRKGRI